MNKIATLHLICGLPCSGKTTLAKELEHKHSALRLTPDEWHIRLFGMDVDDAEHDARHNLVEAIQWEIAARVLTLGVNVILDFGFWGKSEREDFRLRASRLGARSEIHFLNVSEEILFERLAKRNALLIPGTFQITEDMMRSYIAVFQPPAEDELVSR